MSAAGLVLGLVLAFATGGLLVWNLWPGRARPLLLVVALAWPAGLALTSSAYFLWMVISGGRSAWVPALEVAGLLALSLWTWRRARGRRVRLVLPARPRPVDTAALLVLASVAAWSLVLTLRLIDSSPWGYWDAWARIDLKAVFLARGGSDWTWIFRGDGVPHHDYPLLLECSVARLWSWSGGIDPLAPQVLSVGNWAACLAALLALVATLRSAGVTALAGLAFLGMTPITWWSAMQYADLLLATYFLWSAGLLVLAARRRATCQRFWPLLAFCAGSAAWCKNEGLVLAALALVLAVALGVSVHGRRWRAASALVPGLLLGGVAVLVLRTGFAREGSLFGARTRSVVEDLTDLERHAAVAASAGRYLAGGVAGWALALLAVAFLLLPRGREARRSWLPLLACAGMSAAFWLVLVATTEDLAWHLATTMDRFLLQLWPLAILAAVALLPSRA